MDRRDRLPNGGVLGMDVFRHKLSRKIYREQLESKETAFCVYSSWKFTLFASLIQLSAIGAVLSALKLNTLWGRRPVLISGLALMFVGVPLITWFPNISVGVVGMLLNGFGVGLIHRAIPTICRETTPEGARRMLNNTYQFSVRVGGALAPAMNYIASHYPLWGWRLSFGIVSVPISLLVLVSIFIGETPTCLIQHDKVEEAKRILRRIRGTSDIEVEFRELLAETRRCQSVNTIAELLSPPNLPPLVITTVAEILLPWSALVKYSVDFLGRQVLLLLASVVTFASLVYIWSIFHLDLNPHHHLKPFEAGIVSGAVLLFFVGFSALSGPHGWLSETFSTEVEALGSTWRIGLSFTINLVVSQVSLRLLCLFGEWSFIFFAVSCAMMGSMIYLFVPETTNIPKHAFASRVWSRHWFWKRCVSAKQHVHDANAAALIEVSAEELAVGVAVVDSEAVVGAGCETGVILVEGQVIIMKVDFSGLESTAPLCEASSEMSDGFSTSPSFQIPDTDVGIYGKAKAASGSSSRNSKWTLAGVRVLGAGRWVTTS
ncbi:hypothetical protein RJ640_020070 [Escallonia rubra]|uniref:Major facilitator superfamily (MFS) profile domain-containing protein n=1 Tax=Escallonia rubra TaxID=112253 RepID=A0AA88QZP3_9ASTE|nr:hypothetical protein RJ640_020070 [Escallonia rubra]